MVNSAGLMKESIWRDKDFRALRRAAQTTYGQLLSQKELDRAGIQPLQVTKWAKGCDHITEADIWADLKELEASRFVFVDEETDELFVRSYMRHSNVVSQPNLLKNALRCATMVASERLRHELAGELRRLRRADATKVADEIDPGEPISNPSERVAEPIENPSETLPEGLNPSGTLPNALGSGIGSRRESFGLVDRFKEGGARANETVDETAAGELSNDPPSPHCPKHPNGTEVPCRACGQARKARAEWDSEDQRAAKAALAADNRQRAAARAQAIEDCDLCDDDGYAGMRPCDHVVRASFTRGRSDA